MFTHVVLSGGSFKCLTSLGCLRYHEHQEHLGGVRTWVGVSAGAMICLYMALGFNTDYVIRIVYSDMLRSASTPFDVDAVFGLVDSLGMDDGSVYIDLMRCAIKEKMGSDDATFGEVHDRLGIELVVGATNVRSHQIQYFSVHTHRDTSVIQAVRASMCIPLLFSPVFIGDDCFVDGALLNNFPLDQVPTQCLSTTLAISIVGKCHNSPDPVCTPDKWTFLDYIRELIVTVTNRPMADERSQATSCHTLLQVAVDEPSDTTLFCFSFDELRFAVDPALARQYVQQGYTVAKCQCETRSQCLDQTRTAVEVETTSTCSGS